jgi:hypothetical protein
LIAVSCTLSLTACGHSASRDSVATDTPTVIAATPTPRIATPTTTATATPAPTAAATATTPLLSGPAVLPGQIPPTHSSYENHDNAAGALAFAAYFYKALDWSIATTNPNLLRPISAPTCTACRHYIDGLDSLAAAGGHSDGGRMQATNYVIAHGDLVKADYVVQVTATQGVEVITRPDAAPSTYGPTTEQFVNYLYIAWRDATWQALEIG